MLTLSMMFDELKRFDDINPWRLRLERIHGAMVVYGKPEEVIRFMHRVNDYLYPRWRISPFYQDVDRHQQKLIRKTGAVGFQFNIPEVKRSFDRAFREGRSK